MHDIHTMPGHLIRRLQQISLSVFTEQTAAAGIDLTPIQYAALKTIHQRPGIDQATLAGDIAYDRATIGGVIDRLERKSLINRRVSPRDRRARQLTLTAEGADLLARAEPVVERVQTAMLAGLDPMERSLLIALLRKATDLGNDLSRAPHVRQN